MERFPNAALEHCADTTDLRTRLDAAGWTHAELALLAGVTVRTIERYLSPTAAARGHVIPYPLQFTLEAIARRARAAPAPRRRRAPKRPPPPPKPAAAPSWRDRLRERKP